MRRGLVAAVLVVLAALPGTALGAPDPLRGQQWGLSMIEADAAHSVTRGAGAEVAVIDSGVLGSHPDLGGRLLPGRDFVQGDDTPQDGDGHGTHVTGIVAANGDNGVGISSVAPGARVLPIRVLDESGSGSTDNVAAGIDLAVDRGADVINLSLGVDGTSVLGADPVYEQAVDRALDRGVVVVAAAGNTGLFFGCDQPSGRGRLLCVGSVDRTGARSFFSTFGQGLGITAPGEEILSTLNDGGYGELSGTSQAAPHVAGVAALLVSAGVRGQSAVDRILATARDAGPSGPDAQYGAGIVNARNAVAGLGSGGTKDRSVRLPASGRVSVAKVARIRTVLRRGLRVRCRAVGAGTCRVLAKRRKTSVARGAKRLRAGRTATVKAKVGKRGRKLLRRALKRRKRVKLLVRVRLPGSAAVTRRVTLRP